MGIRRLGHGSGVDDGINAAAYPNRKCSA